MNKSGRYHSTIPVRCGEAFYAIPRKEHGHTPQYALVYIHEGSATYSDSTHSTVRVTAGMAFQRFPENPHTIEYISETRSFYIGVPAEVFRMMQAQNLPTVNSPVIHPGIDTSFVTRHRELRRQLQNEAPQLMMRTLCALQQLIVDTHIRCIKVEGGMETKIIAACSMLSKNPGSPLSLENVAESLGMSYSLFRREFKKNTGISPGLYRIHKRIEQAQQLLQLGHTLASIAATLGYSDVYAFSAQFKKFCRCSPGSYRQNFKS